MQLCILYTAYAALAATLVSADLTPSQYSALISAYDAYHSSLSADSAAQSALSEVRTNPVAKSLYSDLQVAILTATDVDAVAISAYTAIDNLPSAQASVMKSIFNADLSIAQSVLSTSVTLATPSAGQTATSAATTSGGAASASKNAAAPVATMHAFAWTAGAVVGVIGGVAALM